MVLHKGAEIAFFAYPADPAAVIERGKKVLIVGYSPGEHSLTVIEDDLLTGPLADLAPPPA
jgi:hypothetical protein